MVKIELFLPFKSNRPLNCVFPIFVYLLQSKVACDIRIKRSLEIIRERQYICCCCDGS